MQSISCDFFYEHISFERAGMCWNLSVDDFARASHGAEVVLKNKTVPFWSVPFHAAAVAHGAGHIH